MAVLALTRFAGYVLLMLAVRSCVDLFKLTGPSAGPADEAGTARAADPPHCSPCCSSSPPGSGWPHNSAATGGSAVLRWVGPCCSSASAAWSAPSAPAGRRTACWRRCGSSPWW
ncbi:hypothetical protein NKG94_14980 [Micromonospora sp. M12]